VQISALGYDLWSYSITGTGLKFNVDKLGAFLKAEKIPADGKTNRNDGNQEKKPETPTTGGTQALENKENTSIQFKSPANSRLRAMMDLQWPLRSSTLPLVTIRYSL
jgi:hypothetical protein